MLIIGKKASTQAYDISIKSEFVEEIACSSIFRGVHEIPIQEQECGKTEIESCETIVNGQ